jgi:diaminopimelate decarboxylase
MAASAAIDQGLAGTEDVKSTLLLIDADEIRAQVSALRRALPDFTHTFACKANPVGSLLRLLASLGMGMEAASLGELRGALVHGKADVARVVFDSPAKTVSELEEALVAGVMVNVDNFQELERVRQIVERRAGDLPRPIRCGVRVNPQLEIASALPGYCTGAKVSKFGVPLGEQRERIIDAFVTMPDVMNALHVHVGSQGVPLDAMTAGVRAVVDLAAEINERCGERRVRIIDIGGGLSVNFASDEVTPTFAEYAQALRAKLPELFDGAHFDSVWTEFGRSIVAKAGMAMCRVEYTKQCGGHDFATVLSGADMFVRTVYAPALWPLRCEVVDARGHAKHSEEGERHVYSIAGPCCFSQDLLARERALPHRIEPNDYVLMLDVGGYYHSSYSLYNSRTSPALYLYSTTELDDSKVDFVELLRARTIDDTLRFFNDV